jgi:hypothetical protein
MFWDTILMPALIAAGVLVLGVAGQVLFNRVIGSAKTEQLPGDSSPAGRGDAGSWLVAIFGAAAVTIGFIISFVRVEDWPDWPPHSRWQWLFYMVVVVGVVAALTSLAPNRSIWPLLRVITLGVAMLLIGLFMLHPLASMERPWLIKFGFGLFVMALWFGVAPLARREHAGWMLLAMMVAFTAAAMVIVEAAFAKVSQLAGMLAATCGFALAIALAMSLLRIRLSLAVDRGLLPPLLIALCGGLMMGWFYDKGGVPKAAFVLVALSPLTLWLGSIPPLSAWGKTGGAGGWGGWRGWLVRIALIVILPAIAVALTMMREGPPQPEEYQW